MAREIITIKYLLTLPMLLCFASDFSCKKKTDQPESADPIISFPQSRPLPTETISIVGRPFSVELAFTRLTRTRGLMFRKDLAPDAGMLFIFSRHRPRSFYMKNCLINLDIIFLTEGDNGKFTQIASITTMKVPIPGQPLKQYGSDVPVKYVLELTAGTAARLALQPGQTINLPRRIRTILPEEY